MGPACASACRRVCAPAILKTRAAELSKCWFLKALFAVGAFTPGICGCEDAYNAAAVVPDWVGYVPSDTPAPQRLVSIAQTDNGDIWVADVDGAVIRRWDVTGRLLTPVENAATGFVLPSIVARVAPDTMAVWDRGTQQLARFRPDGTLISAMFIPITVERGFVRRFLMLRDTCFLWTERYGGRPGGAEDGGSNVWKYSEGMLSPDSIYSVPPTMQLVVADSDVGEVRLLPPVAPRSQVFFLSDGTLLTGNSATSTFIRVDLTRSESATFDLGLSPQLLQKTEFGPVPDQIGRQLAAALRGTHVPDSVRDRVLQQFADAFEVLPAWELPRYTMAFLDDRNRLWVQLWASHGTGGTVRWRVLDARNGACITDLVLSHPGSVRAVSEGRGTLATLELASDGRTFVVARFDIGTRLHRTHRPCATRVGRPKGV